MERDCVEASDLIDLGAVAEETKGGAPGAGDTLLVQQQIGIGLEDD